MQIAIITKLINNTKFKIDKGDHLLDTHTHILWNIDDGSKNLQSNVVQIQRKHLRSVIAIIFRRHRLQTIRQLLDMLGDFKLLHGRVVIDVIRLFSCQPEIGRAHV